MRFEHIYGEQLAHINYFAKSERLLDLLTELNAWAFMVGVNEVPVRQSRIEEGSLVCDDVSFSKALKLGDPFAARLALLNPDLFEGLYVAGAKVEDYKPAYEFAMGERNGKNL